MASNVASIEIEIKNIEKLKESLGQSLKLAEELEQKLREIKQLNVGFSLEKFGEEFEKVAQKLSDV